MTPELREALYRAWPLRDPLGLSEYVEAITPLIDAAIAEGRDLEFGAVEAQAARTALLAAADDLDRLLRDNTPQDLARRDVIDWLRERANGATP